jgi:homoserine kinase
LGVALDIHNRVTVRRISDGAAQSLDELPANAAALFFSKTELPKFPFVWEISGNVPRSRGLGSSVTVRLGLLAGLNELAGAPCTRETLFGMCAELEGHPDNAAPATFGGFTVAGGKQVARFSVSPELHFVLLIPDCEISTPEARRVLPATIDRLGAARSCANACRITAAFASQNYALLEGAFEDHLHQPYRQKTLIPFLNEVIRAGKDAGALGGFLSGSGSTICCVTLNKVEEVGRAMLSAAPAGSRVVAAVADNEGANQIV